MTPLLRRSIFLAKIWLLEAAIRFALWVFPFAQVRRLVARLGRCRVRPGPGGRPRPEVMVRAVTLAARFIPRGSCLTQALTMEVLLRRAEFRPRLQIGLMRDAEGAVRAHAWIENEGRVVIGDGARDQFEPLPTLEQA
jgi:hypothetical protein